ncbi:hypothetical protein ABK040_012935 [Willaertia magna]
MSEEEVLEIIEEKEFNPVNKKESTAGYHHHHTCTNENCTENHEHNPIIKKKKKKDSDTISTSSKVTTRTSTTRRTTTTSRSKKPAPNVLCCLCGISTPANPANMCLNCIRSQVDITEGIQKEETIFFCRECERYLQPPKYWVKCDLESKELLTLCLKRIHGLQKAKLIDAKFLWTEPHSRRLKVKLTIQKEVFGNGTILQQSFIVDFIVRNQQCEVCQKSHTLFTWNAVVQVRQKLDHKRTFLFLEQLILKHGVHEKAINIKEEADGIDFFFSDKSSSKKLVDFLQSVSPIKMKTSERLVTHDASSNVFNFKYSFSLEIAPICREDLICLPKRLHVSMGGIGPFVLCTKVNKNLFFIDPTTLQTSEIDGALYWRQPFHATLTSRQLSEFTVIDVELLEYSYFAKKSQVNNNNAENDNETTASVAVNGKYMLCEVQVVRSDEMDSDPIIVKSHLGRLLKPGDTVLGYDLHRLQFEEETIKEYKHSQMNKLPEVILVRKVYKKRHERNWKLKTLASEKNFGVKGDFNANEAIDEQKEVVMKKKKNKKESNEKIGIGTGGADKFDVKRREKDIEEFYRELEEDEEMRAKINIYKKELTAKKETKTEEEDDDISVEEDDYAPTITETELLDEEKELKNKTKPLTMKHQGDDETEEQN